MTIRTTLTSYPTPRRTRNAARLLIPLTVLALTVACSIPRTTETVPATWHIVAFNAPPSVNPMWGPEGTTAAAAASAKSGRHVIVAIISLMQIPVPHDWYVAASRRRVEVVKQDLIARGIPADDISVGTIMTERDAPPPPEPGHIIIFVPGLD